MNVKKIALLLIVSVVMFGGGFFTAKMTSEEVTREIRFGKQNSQQDERIDFIKTLTDKENQSAIDNVTMIFLTSTPLKEAQVDLEKPDVYLSMLSPKESTGLIDARIWFTSNGAIIGDRVGESWNEIDFKSIDKVDADYIKQLMKE